MQVDGRAQTQKLRGLIPGARYEVTVVSVRGFEESEPLTGFLITGEMDETQAGAGEKRRAWAGAESEWKREGVLEAAAAAAHEAEFGKVRGGDSSKPPLSSSSQWPHPTACTELDRGKHCATLEAPSGSCGHI